MPSDQGKKPAVHTKKHIARLERERQQTRLILFLFIAIMVAVVGLLVYGVALYPYLQLQRPVAKVANAEIHLQDFETRVRLQRQQLLSNYSLYLQYQQFGLDTTAQLQQIQTQLDTPEILGQSVLDQLIEEELIRQEAAKRGLTVSAADLEAGIQGGFGFYPAGSPTPTITPAPVITPTIPAAAFAIVTRTPTSLPTPDVTATATLAGVSSGLSATPELGPVEGSATPTLELIGSPTATLAASTATPGPTSTASPTATPYTEAGYRKEYQKSIDRLARQGFNEADYRKYIETQLLREKLFDQITADVQPVQEQVWARHILVSDEALARTVIDRLNNGEDFGTLAKEVSQDTGSGANGGDLGWFGPGVMVAPFEAAALNLEPGVISQPIKSDFGYHIIQVIARQERPLDESAFEQARQKSFNDWLTRAREEYIVETFDFWKERVPTEPNLITYATQSVIDQQTAIAEATQQASTPTPAP